MLDDLLRDDAFLGASIVTRSGILVMSRETPALAPEAFGAMAAAAMGATENAFFQLGADLNLHVVAESQTTRLITVALTSELLLVVTGRPDREAARSLANVQQAARRLSDLLKED